MHRLQNGDQDRPCQVGIQQGRDHLDLVNLRAYPVDSIAEHFGVLAELRDAGLIRHLGVSSIPAP
jgi:aryl-alcohol dehydrogenase-like predicted oxidoreductase